MAYEVRRSAIPPLKPHQVTLAEREKLTVTGVEEVESFDETEISMLTGEGKLTVSGEGMRIDRLNVDNGDVNILGSIRALRYEDHAPEKGFWARLWR